MTNFKNLIIQIANTPVSSAQVPQYDIVSNAKLGDFVDNNNNNMSFLYMESEISLFKAKLLQLQQEAFILLNDENTGVGTKEKKLDQTIKKSKQLLVQVIYFIFNSPLKMQEFSITHHNGSIMLSGHLGHLLNYFSRQYAVDIESISKKLLSSNKTHAILNNEMPVHQFLTIFDKYYYRVNNHDKLQ